MCRACRPGSRRPGCVFHRAEPEQASLSTAGRPSSDDLLAIERRRLAARSAVAGSACRRRRGRTATRSVQRVAARAGHDVDGRAGGPAKVGGETVGGDLEFLHRVLRDVVQRSADHVVVVVHAVDRDVAAAAELPGRGDRRRSWSWWDRSSARARCRGPGSASSRKLRPLSGSRSMEGAAMTASTTERAVSTSPTLAASTTTSSFTPATVSVASRSSTWPTRRATDRSAAAKSLGPRWDDEAAGRQVRQQDTARGIGGRLARPSGGRRGCRRPSRRGRAWTAGPAPGRARSRLTRFEPRPRRDRDTRPQAPPPSIALACR